LITRRDFLNGMALTGAGALWHPFNSLAALAEPGPYPPALTGLRGAHPGAFEAAHALALEGAAITGAPVAPAEKYDLIVVGGGISGLSAAHFYRRQVKSDARILILDNHDDFGGHAKRNEFTVDGKTLVTYGGTQSLESPSDYSQEASALLRDLGIDVDAQAQAYDREFFARHGLSMGVYYDAVTFGRGALVRGTLPTRRSAEYYTRQWVPGVQLAPEFAATLAQAPLSGAQRAQLREVLAVPEHITGYFRSAQGEQRFYEQSYVSFLRSCYLIEDEALLKLLSMPLAEDAALGGTGVSLPLALSGGLLGLPPAEKFAQWFNDPSLRPEPDDGQDEYVHHFPDGNATIARALVKALIPAVTEAASLEQCVGARFDYTRLDMPENAVRLRLASLAVHARNEPGGTRVRYLQQGVLHEATASHTVMAGWHMMAAHVVADLPAVQKEAMRANIKMPLVFVQVALRRWQAIQRSGVAAAYCPGSPFQFVQMDFPVHMGGQAPSAGPNAPVSLLMIRMPCPPLIEATVPDLLRAGRAELLGTSYETFEQQVVAQLQGMYGQQGFDAPRDIAAITVNRWPHGYVWEEAQYQGQAASTLAARRHGRIAIANADAMGRAYTDAAIDAAWQAVRDLKRAR
jgi:spermidine dehydrogenase